MAAAALAARKWKNGHSIKSKPDSNVKRNFSNLTGSALELSTIAGELVKKPLQAASALPSQVQSLTEKAKEDFSTLPQEMDVEQEYERAKDLFLQEKLFKMSDPITDEIRHASPWMPSTATMGRDRIFFTAPITGDESKSEAVVEDVPLLLINWFECGCLTNLSDSPPRWKVLAEPGPNKPTHIQKMMMLNQGGPMRDMENTASDSVKRWKAVFTILTALTAFQRINKVNGIAVQPPPNYQKNHCNETSEVKSDRFLRLFVQCSGERIVIVSVLSYE